MHVRPAFLALVAAGGAAGTLARHGVEQLLGVTGDLLLERRAPAAMASGLGALVACVAAASAGAALGAL